MKMGILGSGLFWGIIFILLGLSIIIKVVFNIHIPVFRIVFAIFIIYLGINMLMGWSWKAEKYPNKIYFSEQKFSTVDSKDSYQVVFGKGFLDLSGINKDQLPKKVIINTAFGGATVNLPKEIPVKIMATSAFGAIRMPDQNLVTFGKQTYQSRGVSSNEPALEIIANVAFGGLELN